MFHFNSTLCIELAKCLHYLRFAHDLAPQHFRHLQRIAERVAAIAQPHAILAVGTVMVLHYPHMARHAVCRRTPCAHRHEIHRYIPQPYAVHIYQPQQVLEVRRHSIRSVELAKFIVTFFTAIKRRMRRHVTEHHHPPVEESR